MSKESENLGNGIMGVIDGDTMTLTVGRAYESRGKDKMMKSDIRKARKESGLARFERETPKSRWMTPGTQEHGARCMLRGRFEDILKRIRKEATQ